MYRLKIAGTDQVSFEPVPLLMAVKIIWSTALKFMVRQVKLPIC